MLRQLLSGLLVMFGAVTALAGDGRYVKVDTVTLVHVPAVPMPGGGWLAQDVLVTKIRFDSSVGTRWNAIVFANGAQTGNNYENLAHNAVIDVTAFTFGIHMPGSLQSISVVAAGSNFYLDSASKNVNHP